MEFVFSAGPAAVVFWLATALWLAETLLLPSVHGGGAASPGGRRQLAGVAAAVLAGACLTGLLYHFRLGNLDGTAAAALRAAGLALYAGGAALRWAAARALGPWLTRDVRVDPDHDLVGRGPYRRLRHPLYLGLWMLAVGLTACMANPAGAVAAALLTGGALAVRMHSEERRLEAALGERWREWAAVRYRVLPGVW